MNLKETSTAMEHFSTISETSQTSSVTAVLLNIQFTTFLKRATVQVVYPSKTRHFSKVQDLTLIDLSVVHTS
jgi:hypothetical protein